MLRRYAAFFSVIRSVTDIVVTALVWIISYYIRFAWGLFPNDKGISSLKIHLTLVLPVLLICYVSCKIAGLYEPMRIQSIFKKATNVTKATVFSGLFLMAFLYYTQSPPYSRILVGVFCLLLLPALMLSHLLSMSLLRFFRRRGFNIRYYAVIGTGARAQQLVRDLNELSYMGLKIRFFADDNPQLIGRQLMGVPVYGPVEQITERIQETMIDEVYLATEQCDSAKIYKVLETMQLMGITIRIIPNWGNLVSICKPTIVPIGTQHLFSAGDSPLFGFNIILKEVFDRVVGGLILACLAIPMLLITVAVKLTSKGPVFYKQRRVGMDQREFQILKFRTMKLNAEQETGPKWSIENDPRCTRIGRFLRKTSLDELPQLINVIQGDLSLVGPRPERPNFVQAFSEQHRRYMLRHKVKAGMTGWAQVNGLRGNTSLRKRLIYDLYYVKNWSLAFDLWILLLTPLHLLTGENAQ